MKDFIVKENTALLFFTTDSLNIKDKQKEFLVWNKLLESFSYDEDVTFNLIFIDHPTENYIGISLQVDDMCIMQEKVKRYSEGLAYLLVYYFPNSDIRVLSQNESLTLVANLMGIDKIPIKLTSTKPLYMEGKNDIMRVLFARIVNPIITLNKLFEFYGESHKEKMSSIETRIGVKSKCDKRILEVLEKPYLAYLFKFYPTTEKRNEDVQTFQGLLIERDEVFIQDFLDIMAVPNIYEEMILEAKSTSEIFDNPNIMLVPPEMVAKFILGFEV